MTVGCLRLPLRLNQIAIAFESVRFSRLDLERQTTLNSAGSAALCDVGAVADSYGALIMCRT